MKLFLDCEYNGFGGALISMALVSEDGREWYEVVGCGDPNTWVAEHVMPILNKPAVPAKYMQWTLWRFLAQFEAVHVIADWPEDIGFFCASLIVGAGQRIDTPPLTMEIVRVDSESDLPHNALHDARAIRRKVMGVVG